MGPSGEPGHYGKVIVVSHKSTRRQMVKDVAFDEKKPRDGVGVLRGRPGLTVG